MTKIKTKTAVRKIGPIELREVQASGLTTLRADCLREANRWPPSGDVHKTLSDAQLMFDFMTGKEEAKTS